MEVIIKGISKEAFARLMKDLKPKAWFKRFYDDTEGNMIIVLSDGAMLKTHTDSITIDCGYQYGCLDYNEFVEVKII